jgi:hypothetical protein
MHLVIGQHPKDGPKVIYIGDSGGKAEDAYNTAKGFARVEHHANPFPTRSRDGDKASKETVVRSHIEAKS